MISTRGRTVIVQPSGVNIEPGLACRNRGAMLRLNPRSGHKPGGNDMGSKRSSVVIALSFCWLAFSLPLRAQEENWEAQAPKPEFWSVTGVSSDDVLNIRDVPSADSRSLGGIPPHAHGVRNLGCRRNQLSLERWMNMSQSDRQDAQMLWCRVEYRGLQGWVAGRFLKADAAPK
jgi:hypothetical protein